MSDSGKTDEAKGRVKEAAGSLLDDDKLRREGRTDQAAGDVKQRSGELLDKAKQKVDELVDSAKDALGSKDTEK